MGSPRVKESAETWAAEPDSTSVQNRCTIVSWPCEYKCLCICVSHCIKTNYYQPLYHSSALLGRDSAMLLLKEKKKKKKKGDSIYNLNT